MEGASLLFLILKNLSYHSNDSLEDTNESYIVNYEPFLKLSGINCLHEVIDLVISSQI